MQTPYSDMEFLRSVLDGMIDMVRVIDDRNRVVLANTPMDRTVGETVGKPCYALCSGLPGTECICRQALDEGRTFFKDVQLNGKIYSVIASPLKTRGMEESRLAIEVWRDVTELYEINRKIEQQNQALKTEMSYARRLQYNMLPKRMPECEGYTFAAEYRPCEDLSGDLYDLFEVDNDHLAFCIADVAGHGITAAMLTVYFGRLLRSEMRPGRTPAQVLDIINERFNEMEFEEYLYITAVLGVLELSTGKVTWCNAGHAMPPEFFAKDAEGTLYMPGPPICRWNISRTRRDAEFILAKGAQLFLYTDGLECLWGRNATPEDIHAMLGGLLKESQGKDILRRLSESAPGGQETLNDDAAMLLLCREGCK